ncbi:unnamed protein product [Rotaria sordida]|uniref:Cytochrome P450 n=1 Tax=Rotaria sordida TaxID=392033 RepID=A0A814HFV0_9BILA|nr:unnamed protein product [Rotaria sordida]
MFFVLIVVVVVLLVVYAKLKYFTLRGPLPGLPPQFLFGNLIQSGLLLGGVSLPQVYLAFQARFGDIFQFWLGPTRVIVVSGIADVQHIFSNRKIYDQGDMAIEQMSLLLPDALICTRGAKYKRHASIVLPLFRRGKIISNLHLIVDCVDKLLAKWRLSPPGHIYVDIVIQCQNLLLLIFGLIAFNYDLETLDDNENGSDNELTRELRDLLSTMEIVLFSPPVVTNIYLKLSRRHRRAKAIIERYLYRIIEQELNENSESMAQRKRTSLIASLISSLQTNEKLEAIKHDEEKKGLSRSELLNEMVGFLVAGFETTSTALSWFIHLMSKHSRVQQKIKAELTTHNIQHSFSVDQLDSLIYLDSVINEVLRYSPPVEATVRTLTIDDRLPESGAQLFKGDQVLIPFDPLARNTHHWSIDPNLFYPERFLNEDKNHSPYALIPFGGGHRQCIGQDLARFELKIIAVRLMQHVTFGDGGPELNAGGHLSGLTIMPKHVGVTIQFNA